MDRWYEKKVSNNQVAQRLSPRKPKSNWTELNKERMRRLERLGLMRRSGLSVLPDMRPESFTINGDIETLLKREDQVNQNFMDFPELYRRIRVDTIQSYRKEPATVRNRLDKLIENTRKNKTYGQWNDNGRLTVY